MPIGIDLSDFVGKLRAIVPDIERNELFPKAVAIGAKSLKKAIEARTPVGKAIYTYQYGNRIKTVKSKRPPGQAKGSVIVYKRKRPASYYQADVNTTVALLVGYEKRMGYYMYWNEYGRKGQPARPVIRPAFDSNSQSALDAALSYIKKEMGA